MLKLSITSGGILYCSFYMSLFRMQLYFTKGHGVYTKD